MIFHHICGESGKEYHVCGELRKYHGCGVIELGFYMVDSRTLHEKLTDKSSSFLKILKLVISEGDLDYWWQRDNPPNESLEVFKCFLRKLKGPIEPAWIERESEAGPHGLLGEDECFKFEKNISILGVSKKYFLKGYFFNKGDRKGVTIQSFREVTRLKVLR